MAHSHIVFLISISLLLCIEGRIITFRNRCNTTIWPSFMESYDDDYGYGADDHELARQGYKLKPRESINITTPEDWSAVIYGQTKCSFNYSDFVPCVTGACLDDELQCTAPAAGSPSEVPPFTSCSINTRSTGDDSYWIDLRDGFNLPMSIFPYGHNSSSPCQVSSCLMDINKVCPNDMQMRINNEIVACESACYGDNENCNASNYANAVNKACPKAVITELNSQANIFLCTRANYIVSFC